MRRLRGLYAIADDSSPHPPLSLVEAFLAGGAAVIQLRLKRTGGAAFLAVARAAAARCSEAGALLLVNDRPDIALLSGADGVHLGQEDLPCAEARSLLGREALIGVSAYTDAEMDAAGAAGADYLGFGPIFATLTRALTAPDAAPLPEPHGIAGLARAVARTRLPLVAIGGIDAANAADVAATGAAGAAAISYLGNAARPTERAREMVAAFAAGAGRVWSSVNLGSP